MDVQQQWAVAQRGVKIRQINRETHAFYMQLHLWQNADGD
jgi:hypothetical protein